MAPSWAAVRHGNEGDETVVDVALGRLEARLRPRRQRMLNHRLACVRLLPQHQQRRWNQQLLRGGLPGARRRHPLPRTPQPGLTL